MKIKFSKTLHSTLIFLCLSFFTGTTKINTAEEVKPILKFSNTGQFKIVQFADIQDGPSTDPRTLELMNKILDKERPNLVILTGDNVDGKCKTASEVRVAITNFSKPMEARRIPWAVIFGNHDADHGAMTKEEMMRFYMSFSNNISCIGFETSERVGNYNLLVQGSRLAIPMFNIYMLDSGGSTRHDGYESITEEQKNWYLSTSKNLEYIYKRKIPALMFIHIPLPEFKAAYEKGYIDGVRLEAESSPKVNTNFFKAVVENGDVRGIFAGHDHINTYTALLNDIKLGYAGNTGYGTYGSTTLQRGARVFEINESNPAAFTTRMVFAGEVGASITN